MPVGEDARDRLAFQESRAGGQARIYKDVRPESPDKQRIARPGAAVQLARGLLAVAVQRQIARSGQRKKRRRKTHGRNRQQRDEQQRTDRPAKIASPAARGDHGQRRQQQEIIARKKSQAEDHPGGGKRDPRNQAPFHLLPQRENYAGDERRLESAEIGGALQSLGDRIMDKRVRGINRSPLPRLAIIIAGRALRPHPQQRDRVRRGESSQKHRRCPPLPKQARQQNKNRL